MYEGSLGGAGLRGGQLPIFVCLALMETATISQLGAALVMDRTTLTRNLKPLERDGQIAIHPGEDRRTREISLTPKGYRTLSRALPLWKKNHDWVVKKLGKSKAKAFLDEMASILEIVRGM
jgi:DNA-binding MarR family transcriptional regulator